MEKLLAFHFNETDLFKLRQLTATLKIHLEVVETIDYMQTLDALVSDKKNPLAAPFTGDIPEENLLLLCDFTEKRMDKLLLSLRKSQIPVDYKAILTPTNRQWNVMRLLLEMRVEKSAYERHRN